MSGKEKAKFSNKIHGLQAFTPAKASEDEPEELSREEKLLENLAKYPSVKAAAIASGYSEKYASGPLYKRIRGESFQRKLREHYKGSAASMLPFIQSIEQKALEHVDKDITQLPKFAGTLKQIKQATGILSQDSAPAITMIKVDNIQKLMLEVQEGRMQGAPALADVLDVEAEGDEEE